MDPILPHAEFPGNRMVFCFPRKYVVDYIPYCCVSCFFLFIIFFYYFRYVLFILTACPLIKFVVTCSFCFCCFRRKSSSELFAQEWFITSLKNACKRKNFVRQDEQRMKEDNNFVLFNISFKM